MCNSIISLPEFPPTTLSLTLLEKMSTMHSRLFYNDILVIHAMVISCLGHSREGLLLGFLMKRARFLF